MAFDKSGLNLAAGSKNGAAPKVWTYKTTDALTTVDAAGYFDNGATTNTGMRNLMAVGDMIVLHCTSDTVPTFGIAFVNSNSAGIIDTTNATAVSIDSD
jgi:hypothetical protein